MLDRASQKPQAEFHHEVLPGGVATWDGSLWVDPLSAPPSSSAMGKGMGRTPPLLAHAIMQWDTTPTTVTLGQKLFQTFSGHQGASGSKGGCPKHWLEQFITWASHRKHSAT